MEDRERGGKKLRNNGTNERAGVKFTPKNIASKAKANSNENRKVRDASG